MTDVSKRDLKMVQIEQELKRKKHDLDNKMKELKKKKDDKERFFD